MTQQPSQRNDSVGHAVAQDSKPTRPRGWRPTFSVRGLLLLVLLLCVAAGFVHLHGQLRLAEQILIVNGLKWEPIELAPDEFRVTMQHRIEGNDLSFKGDDLSFFIARLHAEGRVEINVMEDSEVYSGIMWSQPADDEPEGLWVIVFYDSIQENDTRKAKLGVEVSRGLGGNPFFVDHPWYEVPADSSMVPQLKSGVYKRGQAIPLFDLDGKKYTLLVD